MKARRLLAVSILGIVFGCVGHDSPTAPGNVKSVPLDPKAVLSDGAHGGNPDFFFLPPLVPLPYRNANFELGKFNNTLQSSLRVEICRLKPEYNTANVQVLPLPHTQCVAGAPTKTFAAGSVQLVNLPLTQYGWWNALNLPPDGFYYVLWDTRASSLDVNSYYRIKVFVDGNATPMGFADVDPMANIFQWKSALTGDVIQLVNGWLLPIPFRIEKGALCGGANGCTSTTVTNFDPSGFQTVTVDGGAGAIAGARFPNGWLPAGGPQSVVVTISSVNTGPSNSATGTQTNPCHAGLNFEQFDSCFKFTTTPTLVTQTNGKQFATPVTVAVCFVLQGTGDPRETFAEMYASGPYEPPHALTDVSDAGILSVGTRNCSTAPPVITSAYSNPLARLASTGWRKLTGGLGQLFSVRTAYAVDVGLGGLLDGFSNVGAVVPAQIQSYGSTETTLGLGATTTIARAQILGNHSHQGNASVSGINGMLVTFTVTTGNGTLQASPTGTPASQLAVTTSTFTDNSNQTPVLVAGISSVIWTPPSAPGTYQMTASGPATGGPITFTAQVLATGSMLSMQTGATAQLAVPQGATVATWASSDPSRAQVSTDGVITAVIGGESTSGTGAASISSVLSTGAAGPSALVNSLAFNIYPRVTTLAWAPVAGAATYDVAIDFGNGCSLANCSTWTDQGSGSTGLTGLTYTFNFVGAQPGRWRVTAKDAYGTVISTSPFVYFGYNI